jgi:hypothetical protein
VERLGEEERNQGQDPISTRKKIVGIILFLGVLALLEIHTIITLRKGAI